MEDDPTMHREPLEHIQIYWQNAVRVIITGSFILSMLSMLRSTGCLCK